MLCLLLQLLDKDKPMVHSPQPRLREGQTETQSERARGEGAREREKKGMEGRNVQLEAPAARSGSEAHPQRILGWRLKTSRTQPNSSLTSHTHTPLLLPSFLPFTPSPSLPPHISLAALQTKEEATERKKPRNLPPCACGGEVQGRGSCLRRRRGKGGRREAAPAPAPGARASCAAPRPGCTAAPTRPRSAGAATRRCTAPTSWWRATRARSCAGAARAPRRGAPRARASAPPPPSATAASAAALALWAWAAATRRWAARATAAATKKRTTTTTAATMTTRWSLRTTRMRRRRRRKGRGRTRSCRGRRRPRRRRRPSPVPRPAAAGRPPPTARAPQIAQRCRL